MNQFSPDLAYELSNGWAIINSQHIVNKNEPSSETNTGTAQVSHLNRRRQNQMLDFSIPQDGGTTAKDQELAALNTAIEEHFRSNPALPPKRRFGLNAFKRGWSDARDGNPCPYHDHRTFSGSVTFSRAFRKEWQRGADAYRSYRGGGS